MTTNIAKKPSYSSQAERLRITNINYYEKDKIIGLKFLSLRISLQSHIQCVDGIIE